MSDLQNMSFSMLELASLRDDDAGAGAALQRALQTVRHAEALGFERFWVAEHHNMKAVASSATSVFMGFLAAHTERIRIGSGGIMLPNHAPLVVAEQIGTLAALYPGRIDLGVGRAPGTDPLTTRALRRHLDAEADSFPADVSELLGYLGPIQPGQRIVAMPGVNSKVPVWLLGSSLFSAQLAAQMGLPYAFASHFAPRFMMQAIELYRSQFQPSEQLNAPRVMLGVPLVLADTDEQAWRLATTAQQRVLSLVRGNLEAMRAPVDSMDGLWSAAEKEAVQSFLGMAVIGSPATARQRLQVLLEHTQADELIFTCDIYELDDRLHALSLFAGLKN